MRFLPGDRALTDLLRAHGLVMNDGVLHAVECLTAFELSDAESGFRFYGLEAAAFLLSRARTILETDDDLGVHEKQLDLDRVPFESGRDSREICQRSLRRKYEAISCFNSIACKFGACKFRIVQGELCGACLCVPYRRRRAPAEFLPLDLTEIFAHSHSASQFLRHRPQHWNSIMEPPH